MPKVRPKAIESIPAACRCLVPCLFNKLMIITSRLFDDRRQVVGTKVPKCLFADVGEICNSLLCGT